MNITFLQNIVFEWLQKLLPSSGLSRTSSLDDQKQQCIDDAQIRPIGLQFAPHPPYFYDLRGAK